MDKTTPIFEDVRKDVIADIRDLWREFIPTESRKFGVGDSLDWSGIAGMVLDLSAASSDWRDVIGDPFGDFRPDVFVLNSRTESERTFWMMLSAVFKR